MLQERGDPIWGTGMAQWTIGGPAALKEVTGIDDPRADAVLDRGGAVVFDDHEVSGGKITLVVRRQVAEKANPGTATVTTTYVTVPAIYRNPAGIATGLALADGRADQETLAAVGASPWTRRWLAGSTALVITGLGVLIGVPLGFAIAEGLVRVS
ncbi:MAG TPA: hypothetical protein VH372_05965 [Actinospica sp.]|nr:hypothetical protein [Actinospica sp.]